MIYKFLSWDKETSIDKIMKEIAELALEGWKVVSHSHSQYGMSIILSKEV